MEHFLLVDHVAKINSLDEFLINVYEFWSRKVACLTYKSQTAAFLLNCTVSCKLNKTQDEIVRIRTQVESLSVNNH